MRLKKLENTNNFGCVLIDLIGLELTSEEIELLQHPVCAGVILFARNYQNPQQLKDLTARIRQVHPYALIAVDQEGGRVQRFKQGFSIFPPMSHWGQLYEQDLQICYLQFTQAMFQLTSELKNGGVNLNLIPVLDMQHGVSEVIGQRSLHHSTEVVIELGQLLIQELHRQGYPAVGKHFPGHGGVVLDSHTSLPIDERNWAAVWNYDLKPFVALLPQLDAIMPAHIIFSAMDSLPACFSPFWLKEVLRNQLGFQGVIISDDLSMTAAASRGGYGERAKEAFLAGCDLLLVCNNRAGAIEALAALLPLNRKDSALRVRQLLNLS